MKYFPPKTLELTLALIKPHAAINPLIVENIKGRIINENFFIVQYRKSCMNVESASAMYEEHQGKPFYNRLVSMMTSNPTESFILARENGIKHWRGMMGPTRALEAQFTDPNSIRGQFGLSNTRNATHGSDSPDSAKREFKIFFPDFDVEKWYETEEAFFRNGYVQFDEKTFTHQRETNYFPKDISSD